MKYDENRLMDKQADSYESIAAAGVRLGYRLMY